MLIVRVLATKLFVTLDIKEGQSDGQNFGLVGTGTKYLKEIGLC